MPWLKTTCGSVHYDIHGGQGPWVCLTHNFLMDGSAFAAQIGVLSRMCRVIVWDTPGFGRTQYSSVGYTLWGGARLLLQLLDAVGATSATLVGISQGAGISLRASLLAPARVERIAVISSTARSLPDAEGAGLGPLLLEWSRRGPPPGVLEGIAETLLAGHSSSTRWIERWSGYRGQAFLNAARAMITADDISDRLPGLKVPALVVHGADDQGVPSTEGQLIARLLPSAERYFEIAARPHVLTITHEAELNAVLVPFITEGC